MHFFLKIIRYTVCCPTGSYTWPWFSPMFGTMWDNLIEKSENSFVSSSLDCKTYILYYWLKLVAHDAFPAGLLAF